MVTSKWSQRERRDIQRRALRSCAPLTGDRHAIELLFFMGDYGASEGEGLGELAAAAEREQEEFGDLVQVGGPDSDPPVYRDVTYVLDRPCARTYRLAHGSRWLVENRPQLDYVLYLDDDSYAKYPTLLEHLAPLNSEFLAMGFTMETELDWSQTHICELCDPCEPCVKAEEMQNFCKQFPDMSYGGCVMAIQNCQIFNDGEDLDGCVREKVDAIRRLSAYFGSTSAPRWLLGMGWVFGRGIVNWIGRNADSLKVRGAADVMLGFWLAPLENIRWVPMNEGQFHDHPDVISMFARECTESTVLVHRLTPQHWAEDFDPMTCELWCPRRQHPLPDEGAGDAQEEEGT